MPILTRVMTERERISAVIDKTGREQAALDEAIPAVGEYIESLGKFDFLTFSQEEFATMVEVAVTAYHVALVKIIEDEVPF